MKPVRGTMSRRALLRGAGGVAIALPLLEAMTPRRAHAAAAPKRLFTFFNENGTVPGAWFPSGGVKDFKLNTIHQPLEPWRDNLILFDGLDQMARGGTAHMRGKCACLTGQPNSGGRAAGISIDQAVANLIGTTTRIKSVETSVAVNGNFRDGVFHSGPGQFIPPEDDPAKVFARLFSAGVPMVAGGGVKDDTANQRFAQLRARRKSILDLSLAEYQRVSATVGSGDRQRLARHMDVIRQVEHGLDATSVPGAASMGCKLPAAPAPIDFVATGKAHLDLIIMAFACDITRVGSIQWRSSDTSFTWVGVNGGHHNISHMQGGAGADASLVKIMTWFAGQVAYILGSLKSFDEPGGGSLLDGTLLYWVNELAVGNHRFIRTPYILAGGKIPLDSGKTLEMGRYLKFPDHTPHTGLLTCIGQIMGLPINNFGATEWQRGPLPGVL
jgi:hypothetical protein